MAENRSRTNLRTLTAISIASTTPGGGLAQAIADCVRRLPGTATATVAYIDQRIEAHDDAARRQTFFLNLVWRPDGDAPVAWSHCGPLVREAVARATLAHGGRLLSFDLVSLVLWRHLVAGADGVVQSSPLVPRQIVPARRPGVVKVERTGLARRVKSRR